MHERETTAAVVRVTMVFGTLKTVATLLEAIDPHAILRSWDHQEAILPFTDPTLMQQIVQGRDDMARKKRLLEAARSFLNEWNAVKAESLAAEGLALSADPRSRGAGRAPPPGRGYDEEDAPGNEEGA